MKNSRRIRSKGTQTSGTAARVFSSPRPRRRVLSSHFFRPRRLDRNPNSVPVLILIPINPMKPCYSHHHNPNSLSIIFNFHFDSFHCSWEGKINNSKFLVAIIIVITIMGLSVPPLLTIFLFSSSSLPSSPTLTPTSKTPTMTWTYSNSESLTTTAPPIHTTLLTSINSNFNSRFYWLTSQTITEDH